MYIPCGMDFLGLPEIQEFCLCDLELSDHVYIDYSVLQFRDILCIPETDESEIGLCRFCRLKLPPFIYYKEKIGKRVDFFGYWCILNGMSYSLVIFYNTDHREDNIFLPLWWGV